MTLSQASSSVENNATPILHKALEEKKALQGTLATGAITRQDK